MQLVDLREKYQQEGASVQLLEAVREQWIKWQGAENSAARRHSPTVNEEFSVLIKMMELELRGMQPTLLTHREFIETIKCGFKEAFIGNTGVVVVR